MKVSKEKMDKIMQLLQDEISDAEISDVDIVVTGYQEYEVESYSLGLDADTIAEQIKKILEGKEE